MNTINGWNDRSRRADWRSVLAALGNSGMEAFARDLLDHMWRTRKMPRPYPGLWDRVETLWADLDSLVGDIDPAYWRSFVKAGEALRCRQLSLQSYLTWLAYSFRLSQTGLARAAGVREERILWWGSERSLFTRDHVESLVASLDLRAEEARHFHLLREDELSRSPRSGLRGYIASKPYSLAYALGELRAVNGWSLEEVAARAGILTERWQDWELSLALPDPAELLRALGKLAWLDQESLPAGTDRRLEFLWRAYGSDRDGVRKKEHFIAATRSRRLSKEVKPDPAMERLQALADEREQAERTVDGFLRFRRQTKEASVEDMAGKAGVDVGLWLAWEQGQALPTVAEAEAMAPRIFATTYLQDKFIELCRAAA